ncbi:phage gp6-like head-tail connector protein [Rhizobium sp. TH2]|uniref:head-tail connector protein n=1 Tax=Rhizobium sp. TH2 TaxID=2775403 RepID=UPI0021574103|nr:head-tail connector protein [Rhizobium sp. TH2]UVC10185.1 phage gp6-like head-tail connector protein [Rhizobium sp. TH2]
MSTITLSLFKAHLGSDELIDADALGGLATATDELLQHYIDAAEARAAGMLGKPLADLAPVPSDVKHAVLLLAAHFYSSREAVLIGTSVNDLPYGVADLLRNYREEVTGYVAE